MNKLILCLFFSFSVSAHAVQESEITVCKQNSDCIVVPYSHCCGSTKKAINKKYLEIYNQNKEWQKLNNAGLCAVIGQCLSDKNVNEAKCEAERCQLRHPKN